MKTKVISDIRVYKSNIPNIDGNSLPGEINNKKLNIVIHRIVMKLREQCFSLGDFDHLYLNLTLCHEKGTIAPTKRSKDEYHPWYKYYDAGINEELYNILDTEKSIDQVIAIIKEALFQHFVKNDEEKELIEGCINQAIFEKENMLMCYKIKESATRKAIIYLRYLDTDAYLPLLCVYDLNNNELLRKDLTRTLDLSTIGTIQLSNKKVTIKPRNNTLKSETYEF